MTNTPADDLRHTPVQARSKKTVEKLEEAAKVVLETIGRDAFTTAHVAEQAGVSIGTLYRYWPDRVAILDHIWPGRADTFFVRKD